MTKGTPDELPPDPFKGDPLSGTLREYSSEPGLATGFVTELDQAIERWAEFADDRGQIQLGAFSGEEITLQRTVRPGTASLTEKVLGRFGMLNWKREMSVSGTRHYAVATTDSGGRTDLRAIKFMTRGESVHVSGEHVVETPEGDITTKLRQGFDLENAVLRATNLVRDGFPVSAEAAIAKKQDRACDVITGNEAIGVQKVLETLVIAAGASALGDPASKQHIYTYEPLTPELDDQWSVKSLMTVLRAGMDTPNSPGEKGRSILSFLNFSPETSNVVGGNPLEAPLLVSVEGIYEAVTNRLMRARVSYATESLAKNRQPLAVDPLERRAIHMAIASQVRLEKLQLITDIADDL